MAPTAPLRMLCPVLVGRDAELAALESFLGEAIAHGSRVALLAGDAGIGKSRLLEAFLSKARAAGARTIVGHCVEAEARRPFGPFVDALRVARGGADIAPIESDVALAEPDGRYRALRSFAVRIGELAEQAPLVVAIDDLQWADEGTLELFVYLGRALREKPILLVAAYRADELHRLHPLRAVLATLARTRTADSVLLRQLSVVDTSELVRATLGLARSAPKDLVAALAERCEGNPFFLEEMLKALAESGTLERRNGAWQHNDRIADLAVPASVRDVVQSRLASLPSDARDALRVAAVIGISFDLALLQQLTAMTDEQITSSLRSAVDGQFVEELAGAPDRFRFRHALTREAVLMDLLGRERRTLHQKIAAGLEARSDAADRAEELAYHYDEAGERELAYRYHLLAGEAATAIFAFGQARRHLERALELAPADADLAGLNLRLSRTALPAGDPRAALRAAEQARYLSELQADTRGIGVALGDISDAQWHLGETETAWRTAEESVRVFESLGSPCELADAYRRMAQLERYDDGSGTEWAQRTIEVARRCGLRVAEVHGLYLLAASLNRQGRPEGLIHGEQALRLALELDVPDLVLLARQYLLDAEAKRGATPSERRARFEELVAHARKRAFITDLLLILEVEEAIAFGDFDEALRLADQITPDTVYGADAELRVALIQIARNGLDKTMNLDAIRAKLLAAAKAWQAFATTTAQLLLLADQPRAALEHAELAKEHLRLGSQRFSVDVSIICAIEAARRLGDAAALDDWIAVALHDDTSVGSLVRQARRAYGNAERAVRNGDLAGAISFSAASVTALDHSQWPFIETVARLRHAELLLDRGSADDRVAAAADLAAVLAFWRKAGAPWYLGRLRDWARQRGLRVPAAVSGARAAQLLTRRQREIAALIANGLTNRQIADQLVISERTVESHVEGIMVKLAVHNRVEIASWVAAAPA